MLTRGGVHVQALVQNDGTAADLSQGSPVQVYLPPDALRVLAGEDIPQDEDEFEVAAASQPFWRNSGFGGGYWPGRAGRRGRGELSSARRIVAAPRMVVRVIAP